VIVRDWYGCGCIEQITGHLKADIGNLAMVTKGANIGRVGVVTNKERHPVRRELAHAYALPRSEAYLTAVVLCCAVLWSGALCRARSTSFT
jgi:hypothetical protein